MYVQLDRRSKAKDKMLEKRRSLHCTPLPAGIWQKLETVLVATSSQYYWLQKKVVYSKAKLRHCYSHIIQGYFESPTRQRSQHIGHSEFGALQVPAPSLCSSSSSPPLMAGYMLHSEKADSERNRIKQAMLMQCVDLSVEMSEHRRGCLRPHL